jgi:hypothetical protein
MKGSKLFILENGRKTGPFSLTELQDRVARGVMDVSMPACFAEGGEWRPLIEMITSDREETVSVRERAKRVWETFQRFLALTVIIVAAIYVLIQNVASWFEEHDSLTAFLALLALWCLRSLPFVFGKAHQRPSDGWVALTIFIFGLGAYACLLHLNSPENRSGFAFGAIASIVIVVFACLEFGKRERARKERESWRDPIEQEQQEFKERHLREKRKREFMEFAKEAGLLAGEDGSRDSIDQ